MFRVFPSSLSPFHDLNSLSNSSLFRTLETLGKTRLWGEHRDNGVLSEAAILNFHPVQFRFIFRFFKEKSSSRKVSIPSNLLPWKSEWTLFGIGRNSSATILSRFRAIFANNHHRWTGKFFKARNNSDAWLSFRSTPFFPPNEIYRQTRAILLVLSVDKFIYLSF